MNLAIMWQTIRAHRKSALYVGLGLGAISFLFSGLFKEISGQIDTFADIMPTGLEAVFGELASAGTPGGWLGIELYALFFPLALSILAVVYGVGVIGKEEQSGTLELLLASPVSRTRILLEKLLALSKLLAFPAVLLWVAIAIGRALFDFDVNLFDVFWATVSGWLLALVFGTLSFAVQALTGRTGLATAFGAGALAATYVLLIVSKLVDSWENAQYFSPFYYYDNPAVIMGSVEVQFLLVLAGLSIAFSLVALLGFRRRDTGL